MLGGCRLEMDDFPQQEEEELVVYALQVHAGSPTRGNIVDEDGMDQPHWRIFQGGELLYSSEDAPELLSLAPHGSYQVFAWANHSMLDDSSPAALLAATHRFSSDEAEWDGMKIPMSLYLDDISGLDLDLLDQEDDRIIRLNLVRLMALVDVEIAYDNLLQTMFPTESVGGMNYGIRVNSIEAGGLGQEVGLFSSEANRRGYTLDDSPVNQSSGTQSYSLFIPESLGGNLLPEGTLPDDKQIPPVTSILNYPYLSVNLTFASYLYRDEIQKGGGSGIDKTFRIYLGENSSNNFDVRRGYHYRVRLLLSYSSMGISGTWRIDGEDDHNARSLSLWTDNQLAAPGETVYLSYRYAYSFRSDTQYYLQRGNGFALGLETDRDAYLSDGTLPEGFTRVEAGPACICSTCGHQYRLPSGGDRLAWARSEVSTDERPAIHCRWCDTDWFSPASAAETAAFLAAMPGDDLGYARFENAPVQVAYTIPSDAVPGSDIHLYGWWRDGSLEASTTIQVGYEAYPSVACTRPGTLWVGQSNVVRVTGWSRFIFGEDPEFSFVLEGSSPAPLRRFTADAALSCELAASRAGNYTLHLLYKGQEMALVQGSVRAPTLTASAGPYSINPWGDAVAVPRPVLLWEQDGVWSEYTRDQGDCLADGRHLWDECLDMRYNLSAEPYFDSTTDEAYTYVYLQHIHVDGRALDVVSDCRSGRTVGQITCRSAACPDVGSVVQNLRMLPCLSAVSDRNLTLYMDPTRPGFNDYSVEMGVQSSLFYNGRFLLDAPGGVTLLPSSFPAAYGRMQTGSSGGVQWHLDPRLKVLPLGNYTLYMDAQGKEDATATRFTLERIGLSRYIYVSLTGQKDYEGTDCYHFKMLVPSFNDGSLPLPMNRFYLRTGAAYDLTGDYYTPYNRIWTSFDATVPGYTVYVESKGGQFIQDNLAYVLSMAPLLDMLESDFTYNGITWLYRSSYPSDQGKLLYFRSSDSLQDMAVALTYHDLAQGNISWGMGFD